MSSGYKALKDINESKGENKNLLLPNFQNKDKEQEQINNTYIRILET